MGFLTFSHLFSQTRGGSQNTPLHLVRDAPVPATRGRQASVQVLPSTKIQLELPPATTLVSSLAEAPTVPN